MRSQDAEPTLRLTVITPRDDVRALRAIARREDLTVSQMVRRLIRERIAEAEAFEEAA